MTRQQLLRAIQGLVCGLGVLWAIGACNNLLNIEQGRLACSHTSQCPDSLVCLYEQCSPECLGDLDCAESEVCALTDLGGRCVRQAALACETDADCQSGARCEPQAGCLYPCNNDQACLAEQECSGGLCVSSNTPGSGGQAGASSSAATSGAGGAAGDASGAGGVGIQMPDCEEGTYRCPQAARPTREICRAGQWEPAPSCESGTLCNTSDPSECVDVAEECAGRSPGEAFCDGSERLICASDLASVEREPCASAAHCNESQGDACAACLAGEFTCDGDELKSCKDDQTGYEDEGTTCSDVPCNALLGECTARVCDADAYYCDATSNILRQCNADGTDFASETQCEAGQLCDAENGECDICSPGTVLGCIDEATREVCDDDGQGSVAVTCADLDSTAPICVGNGLCVECEPLTATCIDEHRLQSCNSEGQWESPQTCMNQACVADACVGVCSPGSTDCADDRSVQSCNDMGTWNDAVSCDGQACSGSSCTGQCEPETWQCVDKFSRQECTNLGSWGVAETCTGQACSGGLCVGSCVPETQRCNNGGVETCSDLGVWQATESCTGQTCVASGGTANCQGNCAPGYQRCNSNNVQNCDATGFYSGTVSNCTSAGETCVASGNTAACQGSCAPGYQRCSNNIVQACTATGTYSTSGTNCTSAAQTCVASGTSAACQGTCAPGYQRCNNNNVQNCNASGSYSGTASNCTNANRTCMESGTTASCTGECAPGATTCIDNDAHHCISGSYSLLQNCSPPGEICSMGACVTNDPYEIGFAKTLANNASLAADVIYLQQLPPIAEDADVLQLGLYGRGNNGSYAQLALYEDDGTGKPGAFLASTGDVLIQSGFTEDAPTPLATRVLAGRTYWAGAVFFTPASASAQLYSNTNTSAPDIYRASLTYGNPFPQTFAPTSTLSFVEYSFYIRVRTVSE